MMIHEGIGSFNSPFEMPHSRPNKYDMSFDDNCRNAVTNKMDSTFEGKCTAHLSRQSSGSSGSNAHPNVFVRGIPLIWSEEEMVTLFEKFGKLTSLRLVRHSVTKASLGYGFVRYAHADDAQSAILALHGTMIGDQILQVKFADADAGPPTNSTSSGLTPCDSCYVKHVPVSFTSQTLMELFTSFGRVVDVKMFPCLDQFRGGSALVKMDSVFSAARCIQGLNGFKPENALHTLIVRFAESTTEKHTRLARKEMQDSGGIVDALQIQQALSLLAMGQPGSGSIPLPVQQQVPLARSLGGTSESGGSPKESNICVVMVENAPDVADKLWMYEQFSRFGAILHVSHDPVSKSGRIAFGSKQAAFDAVRALNDFFISDENRLHVFLG
jgi:hypothetical protein